MRNWIEIELGKLGKTFSGLSGKTKDDFGSGKPYIPYLNIFSNSKINPNALELVEIKPVEKQVRVQYGDIFFTTSSETIEDVGMTSVLLHDLRETYLNSFCFGFRLFDFDTLLPEFAAYLLRSKNVRHQISFNGQGSTRYNLSKNQLLKNVVLTIPTKPEQSTIATILTTIDQAIAKTEQLIAKYERIKTGLMQDLLTRGIDEQGNIRSEEIHEFKDSPLGRIPSEWEVVTLKLACERIQDGTHFSPEISELGEFMYITSKNIRMGELDLGNVEYITREAHESIYRRCSVEYGDVLLTKDGANTGNVSLNTIKEPISLLSSVAFLRGKKEYLKNNFLFQTLASEKLQKTFKDQMSGNAITRTTLTKINATIIAIPKIEEQERIISILGKFDSNLSKEKDNLLKYQSIKTALMQDLLSGKVRVDTLIPKIA